MTSAVETVRGEKGPDAIAGLASARLTNEENYLFQKLFCAKCREKGSYTQKGSVYRTAVDAVHAIGSRQGVSVLKKVREREKGAGHAKFAEEIGKIIEELQK